MFVRTVAVQWVKSSYHETPLWEAGGHEERLCALVLRERASSALFFTLAQYFFIWTSLRFSYRFVVQVQILVHHLQAYLCIYSMYLLWTSYWTNKLLDVFI